MSESGDGFDVENEVAFAALGGWEKSLKDALQAYCDYCERLPPRECQRRPSVLIDFNVWVHPNGAAHGMPIGGLSVEAASQMLANRIRAAQSDPYAIIGALKRECEK